MQSNHAQKPLPNLDKTRVKKILDQIYKEACYNIDINSHQYFNNNYDFIRECIDLVQGVK